MMSLVNIKDERSYGNNGVMRTKIDFSAEITNFRGRNQVAGDVILHSVMLISDDEQQGNVSNGLSVYALSTTNEIDENVESLCADSINLALLQAVREYAHSVPENSNDYHKAQGLLREVGANPVCRVLSHDKFVIAG